MAWAAIGGAVVSAGAGYLANKKSKKANEQAQETVQQAGQQANQQSWSDINAVNALNRENATWTQQQNQAAQDRNMIDSSNAWGGVTRERDPVTGELKQTSSLSGPWADIVGQGASQYGAMQGGLSSDQFGINNDVFKAMQGLSAPQLETQRNRENARLAAMGLGTGSGQAWQSSQENLNNSENNMFNQNVLGANQAWLAGQGNLRSNMGSIMQGQQGLKGLSGQDAWAQATAPQMTQTTVATPENRTWEAARTQANLDMLGGAQEGQNWAGIASGVNGLLGNKDVQSGLKNAGSAVSDWWSNLGGTGSTPGSAPDPGYTW